MGILTNRRPTIQLVRLGNRVSDEIFLSYEKGYLNAGTSIGLVPSVPGIPGKGSYGLFGLSPVMISAPIFQRHNFW